MFKIYVIWQYNPLTQKEQIREWTRNKKQSVIIKQYRTEGLKSSIREHMIPQELVNDLRQIRFDVAEAHLNDVNTVVKKIKADKEKSLLIRHELVVRRDLARERLGEANGWIFDDEVEQYLDAVVAGII